MRASAAVLVVVGVTLVAASARAQQRWHEEPIAALPSGAVVDDLAFHDGEGYLAVRAGDGTGHVFRLRFPADGAPAFDDVGLPPASYSLPFTVSFHGTHVAVTSEGLNAFARDVGAATWEPIEAPLFTTQLTLLEADASGGARFLGSAVSFVGSAPPIHYREAGAWTGHQTGDTGDFLVALLASPVAAGVTSSGRVFVAEDVAALPESGSWTDVGVQLPALAALPVDGDAAWLGGGAMAVVSATATGSLALHLDGLDDGSVVATDCSAAVSAVVPRGFRRVAAAAGVLYALDRDGRVHRIDAPSDCASWASATPSPPFFTDGAGLGAVDAELSLAVGHRASDDVPIVVWRNRAPTLALGADVSLAAGETTTVPVDARDPDPADDGSLALTVSCDSDLVTAAVSGDALAVTAGSFADPCVAEQSQTVTCTVVVSDSEKSASQTLSVEVHSAASDGQPSLVRDGDEERLVPLDEDAAITLQVSVTGACLDEETVRWDLSALPQELWPEDAPVVEQRSADASRALTLAVPRAVTAGLLGTEAEVVASLAPEGDEEPAPPVRFVLVFGAPADELEAAGVELVMTATSARALDLGDVVEVEARLEADLGIALPALTVTLAYGELAVLADTVALGSPTCGARGAVTAVEEGLRLEVEGVRDGCPLDVRFLARKGLAREPLRVTRCTFGDDRPLSGCRGELAVTRPRTLGCTQASGAAMTPLALLVVALVRRRRR